MKLFAVGDRRIGAENGAGGSAGEGRPVRSTWHRQRPDRLRPPAWSCTAPVRPILLALIVLLLVTGCRSASLVTPEPVTLRLAGSTSFNSTLHELAAAYQARHNYVLLDIQGTDSADGLRALTNGEIDLAAVSWQLPGPPPKGLVVIPVASDAVAVIVHPSNRVKSLNLVQIKSLFAGATLDWKALGGAEQEPVLVSREDGSGTRATFEATVMGDERVSLNALVMPSSQAVVSYVATHPDAIGYVSAGEIDARVRALSIENALPVPENVRSGAYHLSRVIYLYRPEASPAATQEFVDFAISPAGQAIIASRHVPVR